MLIITIEFILLIIIVIVIIWPFLFRPKSEITSIQTATLGQERLNRAQLDIREQINQLRNDRDAGLTTEDEFAEQLQELHLSSAAIQLIEQSLPRDLPGQNELEQEIKRIRDSQGKREGGPT